MDLESMLLGLINNSLSNKAVQASRNVEREELGVPDSNRRAFESRMRGDAAVARMAAQNMDDAKSMVHVAQTDITAIKSHFQEIQKSLTECAESDFLSQENVESYQHIIDEHLKEIQRIASNSSFNGMKLMDGGAGDKVIFQLQAGNSSRDQSFMNLCDTNIAATAAGSGASSIIGAGSMNFNNLYDAATGACWEFNIGNASTYQTEAARALDVVDTCIERMQGLEGQYSYDYKSLDNLSLLFEDQADIYEQTAERHSGSSTDKSSILSQLLSSGSGSILSGST